MKPTQDTNSGDSNDFREPEITPRELALVSQSYAIRQVYWPAYTWSLQTEHLNKTIDREDAFKTNGIDVETFNKHRSSLFNKINASFYHLQKLKENENLVLELGKRMAEESKKSIKQGVIGIVGTPYEPVDYEYEALLVTLKSALDITAMMLSQPSGLNSDNIGSLFKEGEEAEKPNSFLVQVNQLLKAHNETINEFRNRNGQRSKRNHAVHQGSLPTGTINHQFTAQHPEIGVLKTRVMGVGGGMPRLKEQKTLDDYTTNLFYNTCDLIIDALSLLVGEALPRGPRCSVYEQGTTKKNS